jgi:hypothetical protein
MNIPIATATINDSKPNAPRIGPPGFNFIADPATRQVTRVLDLAD